MLIVERRFLTLNKYSRPGDPILEPRAIVLHWTASPGQEPPTVWQYYESDEAAADHYGGSHFCIGTDGVVEQFVPENERTNAVGSSTLDPKSGRIYTDFCRALCPEVANPNEWTPNPFTINIEMCIPVERDAQGNVLSVVQHSGKFTDATLESATELVRYLLKEYPTNRPVITDHHELVGWKDCPRYWVNHPEAFAAFKANL